MLPTHYIHCTHDWMRLYVQYVQDRMQLCYTDSSAVGKRNSGRIAHDDMVSTKSSSLNKSFDTKLIVSLISWNKTSECCNSDSIRLYCMHSLGFMHAICTRKIKQVQDYAFARIYVKRLQKLTKNMWTFRWQVIFGFVLQLTYFHSTLRFMRSARYAVKVLGCRCVRFLESCFKVIVQLNVLLPCKTDNKANTVLYQLI